MTLALIRPQPRKSCPCGSCPLQLDNSSCNLYYSALQQLSSTPPPLLILISSDLRRVFWATSKATNLPPLLTPGGGELLTLQLRFSSLLKTQFLKILLAAKNYEDELSLNSSMFERPSVFCPNITGGIFSYRSQPSFSNPQASHSCHWIV